MWHQRSNTSLALKHFTAAYRGFPPCTQSQPPANRETGYSNVLDDMRTGTKETVLTIASDRYENEDGDEEKKRMKIKI